MQQVGLFLPGRYSQSLPFPANDPAEGLYRHTGPATGQAGRLPNDAASLKGLVIELTRSFETESMILRAALQFYADRGHIKVGEFGVAVEDGKRAQDALGRIGARP